MMEGCGGGGLYVVVETQCVQSVRNKPFRRALGVLPKHLGGRQGEGEWWGWAVRVGSHEERE